DRRPDPALREIEGLRGGVVAAHGRLDPRRALDVVIVVTGAQQPRADAQGPVQAPHRVGVVLGLHSGADAPLVLVGELLAGYGPRLAVGAIVGPHEPQDRLESGEP